MVKNRKRKKWNDGDMDSAMNVVEKKEMTIYSAAARFSVPHKTLDDRIKGHVKHGSPGEHWWINFRKRHPKVRQAVTWYTTRSFSG